MAKTTKRVVNTQYGLGEVTTFDSFTQTAIVKLYEEAEDDDGNTITRLLLNSRDLVDVE